MRKIKTQHLIKLARYSFTLSFSIGTILFLIERTTYSSHNLLLIGLFYTITAFCVNAFIFVGLIIMSIIKKDSSIFFNACIMLINIPITLIYINQIFYK